jgi:hypothetical protein
VLIVVPLAVTGSGDPSHDDAERTTAMATAGPGTPAPTSPGVDVPARAAPAGRPQGAIANGSSPLSQTGSATKVSPITLLDYQTGDFSQWAEVQTARPEQAEVVTSPTREGTTYSAKFTVAPGDHTFGDTSTIRGEVRASVADSGSPTEGMDQWFAWSTLFPSDFEWDGDWLSYTQWHQTARTGPPVIALLVTAGDNPHLNLTVRGGILQAGVEPRVAIFDLGPLERGVWLDHKVYVHWSSEPGAGRIGIWINDRQVLMPTAVANLYAGQSVYLKQGLYASASTNRSHTVYHTGTRIGPTEMSVANP